MTRGRRRRESDYTSAPKSTSTIAAESKGRQTIPGGCGPGSPCSTPPAREPPPATQPARSAKQDAHTRPPVTLDGLHLNVGGYRRKSDEAPPARGVAYNPRAALIYIIWDVPVNGERQAPDADVAWPEPLHVWPQALTAMWLVTTDDQCARAARQAQLSIKWVVVQVRAGQPRLQGLHRNATLLLATGVPHDANMVLHALHGGPARKHTSCGSAPARRPGVAPGTPNGAPLLDKHHCRR